LPAALVTMLAAHLSACILTGANESSLVFTSPDGTPLDYSNWRRRVWVPAVRKAGIPTASFHDLRRTNATQLVVSGVDIKTAQSRLGHADPRLTLAVYAQAVGEADRDAAARLDERFFGQVKTHNRHR
jgi:integrase